MKMHLDEPQPVRINLYGDELYSALVDRRTVPNLRDPVPGIDTPTPTRSRAPRMVQRQPRRRRDHRRQEGRRDQSQP